MIDDFRGPNRWLSNFELCEVHHDGLVYGSSEAAYQAAKTLNIEDRLPFTQMTPREAKKAGQLLDCRPDWEQVKTRVMTEILVDKFTRHAYLREKLLATGDQMLIENNVWGDSFWGVCNGKGQNWLGRILMAIRSNLKGSSV